MSSNRNLHNAAIKKDDEFYTLLDDIEAELCHYEQDLFGKHVHMPCDDYTRSNFWRYFYENFERLGLRKITAVGFRRDGSQSVIASYDGSAIDIRQLSGDGDFRSDEGLSAIKECDVVVTNPPFSIWRDFFSVIKAARVQYAIVGPLVAIHSKNVRPDVISGIMSCGKKQGARLSKFERPDGSFKALTNTVFFTNIRPYSTSRSVDLDAEYDPSVNEMYDDLDAINCDKSAMIPRDYEGVIGVPITFLLKLNPDQFEIVGIATPRIRGRTLFERLFIRNKNPEK